MGYSLSFERFELRAEAAIDVERRTGHERRRGACEEQHAGCDFFRLAEALHRVLLALEVEPPVTRAALPESFLVIGFLHCLNSDGHWICRPAWYRNRNY